MKVSTNSSTLAAVRAVLVLFFSLVSGCFGGERYRPASGDVVLVRVTVSVSEDRTPAVDSREVFDTDAVLREARELVRQARQGGDPRFLSRAEALLAKGWKGPAAPVEVSLLRARILQGLHSFEAALAELNLVLSRDSRNVEAWLLKTSIHVVRGEAEAARAGCLQLARFADPLTTATMMATLTGAGPDGARAAKRLETILGAPTTASDEVRAWSWTTLGEIQAYNGGASEAETSYREALRLCPGLVYTQANLADLLLGLNRADEVIQLLEGSSSDALRLRLLEAKKRCHPGDRSTARLETLLDQSFALASARGDELHLREEARYRLRIKNDAKRAHALALRNWAVQKEPADLLLLLEIAKAAQDADGERMAVEWEREHQPGVLAEASRNKMFR